MRVALVGYGVMGQVVERKLIEREHEIVGVISLGLKENLHEIESDFDVIVDFSHPNNLEMVLNYIEEKNVPLVVATTGYSDIQIAKIKEAGKKHPIFYTANFSLGITVMEEVLRQIAPILEDTFDIEVIEKHHNKKIDAPSGTAKMLVDAIDPEHQYERVNGRDGMNKRSKEIGVHAIRAGSIVGEHSVLFAGEDEVLEIKHEAHSKNIFASGAVRAAEFIKGKPAGIYNMHDVLFTK